MQRGEEVFFPCFFFMNVYERESAVSICDFFLIKFVESALCLVSSLFSLRSFFAELKYSTDNWSIICEIFDIRFGCSTIQFVFDSIAELRFGNS